MLTSNFTQYDGIIESITNVIENNSKLTICYLNFFGSCLIYEDKKFHDSIKNSDLLFNDGIGMFLAGRVFKNSSLKTSFNWTDKVFRFLELCEQKKWSIYFVGSTDKILEIAVQKMKNDYPNLKFMGYSNGYENLNDCVIKNINKAQPDILWVGLGTPLQENWIIQNKEKLNVKVIQAVGDVYSEIAGVKIRGGRFVRKIHLEWLIRAMSNPIKYGRRYFLYGPKFILLIINLLVKKYAKSFITNNNLRNSSIISE